MTFKVVIASTSEIKINAVKEAFAETSAEFVSVSVPSYVPEQPVGFETFEGATNRLFNAQKEIGGADYYAAIENGIYLENEKYVDKAVVVIQTASGTLIKCESDGVKIPDEAVYEAAKRGFAEWTVGKVLQEMGLVKDHADPHLDLSGKSRKEYITETVKRAVARLGL